MLSKKSKYAIKALLALARGYAENTPQRISHIAETEKIPRKFLETILLELRNQGFVGSKMGANGGYYLTKHPEEIMLSTIIRVTGGPIAMLPCVSLNFYEPCDECPDEETCGLRDVVKEVREASIRILSKTSLADTLKREQLLEKKHIKPKKQGKKK
ncbi:MAG TPA: Rrf2 family transcriptional regulator [Bacteroidia bacterium]|jgi:Rrf2 family protein|nr:Rrf2 family transcriptional regulator [Bacteroidia bacterium]